MSTGRFFFAVGVVAMVGVLLVQGASDSCTPAKKPTGRMDLLLDASCSTVAVSGDKLLKINVDASQLVQPVALTFSVGDCEFKIEGKIDNGYPKLKINGDDLTGNSPTLALEDTKIKVEGNSQEICAGNEVMESYGTGDWKQSKISVEVDPPSNNEVKVTIMT